MTLKTVANNNLEFNGLPFLNNPDTGSRSLLIFRCVLNDKLKNSHVHLSGCEVFAKLAETFQILFTVKQQRTLRAFMKFCPQLESNSKCL